MASGRGSPAHAKQKVLNMLNRLSNLKRFVALGRGAAFKPASDPYASKLPFNPKKPGLGNALLLEKAPFANNIWLGSPLEENTF